MLKSVGRAVVVVMLSLTSPPFSYSGQFNPDQQEPIRVTDSRWFAELILGNPFKLRLRGVGDKQGVQAITLPPELAQVGTIKLLANNQIAIIGMVNGSVSEMVRVDAGTHSVTDTIYCYKPELAPDGRAMIFVKFYPPHFVGGVSDHYLVYDFDKTPRANRPAGIDVSDKKNVGFPFYPEHVGNFDNDNVGLDEKDAHRFVSARFFWSPDSSEAVFLDKHDDDLVLVRFKSDSTSPTGTYDLTKQGLCPIANCSLFLEHVTFIALRKQVQLLLRTGSSPEFREFVFAESDFR